jgi:hypothetical protein
MRLATTHSSGPELAVDGGAAASTPARAARRQQPFPRRRDRVGARHGRGRTIFTEITGTDAGGEVVAYAVLTYRIV